jgi:hypothetical protein
MLQVHHEGRSSWRRSGWEGGLRGAFTATVSGHDPKQVGGEPHSTAEGRRVHVTLLRVEAEIAWAPARPLNIRDPDFTGPRRPQTLPADLRGPWLEIEHQRLVGDDRSAEARVLSAFEKT